MDMTHLDFPPASFDAVYALNSLLHIAQSEFRRVLQNIQRVLAPAGLFYLGLYGADEEFEGVWENDSYTPKRFFSFKTDETIQETTAEVFKPLYFKRIATHGKQVLHFQSLILEKPGT
jgi:SAM-dependent methyltransferase